tara:strand:+ start:957 stop:1769 length:813 start_codon:yes stop_codon:yes gene_type:complete
MNLTPRLRDKLVERLATPVKPLQQQKKIVTPQEWKFVQELCSGDGAVSMKEAAIRAGWKPAQAWAAARRLTDPEKSPHVVAAIQEFRIELAEKYGTTFERHMRDMQRIRDAAMDAGAYGAAVTAEYRRGQALGTIYIERKEIRHGLIDSMSKEDVMKRLNEMQQLYGDGVSEQRTIIDMSPEEIAEAKKPDHTVAEELRHAETSRRLAAAEDRRKFKLERRYKILLKVYGPERAAAMCAGLPEGGRFRDDDGEDLTQRDSDDESAGADVP